MLFMGNNVCTIALHLWCARIEAGKLTDMIITDRDIWTCPEDDIKGTKVLSTYLGGKVVLKA
jgi:predicted amidohydrolase YtcJ